MNARTHEMIEARDLNAMKEANCVNLLKGLNEANGVDKTHDVN